jgi:hypothetical protein
MRAFLIAGAVLGIGVLSSDVGFTQAKPSAAPSLEGVWEAVSVVATGPNAGKPITNRQFNMNIWTKGYFSRIVYDGPPRSALLPVKDPNNLTTTEKLARYEHWRQLVPIAGRYELKGSRWFPQPLVANNVTADIISRNAGKESPAPLLGQDFTFDGDMLVSIATSADGKTVTRRTYRRLDRPAPGTKPHPIEGVWKATTTVRTGADPASNPNRLPNVFIYKNGYYTFVAQDAGPTLGPRKARTVLTPAKDPANLTEDEKLARYDHWAQVQANAGRYEVKGNTLYQYALLGKSETADMVARRKTGNMGTVQPNSELEFSNGNNTMVQVNRSPDGKSVTRRTYIRLE